MGGMLFCWVQIGIGQITDCLAGNTVVGIALFISGKLGVLLLFSNSATCLKAFFIASPLTLLGYYFSLFFSKYVLCLIMLALRHRCQCKLVSEFDWV